MKFGVCVPNYGETISVDSLRKLALEAEKLEYDSLWTTDHILMPKNSGTPYERIYDSIATLAYLAPQTRKVKLGISSLIIAMRNPLVVAKQLATIDAFSKGRVLLAIGAGWNEKEFGYLGSDFHTRGKRVNESIKLIRALWKGDTKFEGKEINFENAVFEPKPLSDHLTIWIGGTSRAAMKRAADIGDAWHPNAAPLEKFRAMVSEFRQISPNKEICIRIGLDTKASQSEYIGPQKDRRILLSGNMRENKELIGEFEKLGVSCAVLVPNALGKQEIDSQLESIRAFAKGIR
ncbi:MAG: TIGR03619 family F420-dependent LLM class oxidoreductase [Nitrososphaerales archaeon]